MAQQPRHRTRPDPTPAASEASTKMQPGANVRKVMVRKSGDRAASSLHGTIFDTDDQKEIDVSEKAFKDYTAPKQVVDPFKGYYNADIAGGLSILEPDYNPYSLMRLPYENAMLNQCIDAMVINIHGMGWTFEYYGPVGKEKSPEALAERMTFENLCMYPNEDYTLQELKDRVGRDYESQGNAYMEAGRDNKNRAVMLAHLPAQTMRITVRDREPTAVTVHLPRDGENSEVTIKKRFCRYVQVVGTRRVFFKEFGDPRIISTVTGNEDKDIRPENGATEVIHLSQYNPGSPYGRPRWFNQLPAIMGSRQAELTNLDFFKENAIPAMVLLVSGGMVNQDSLDQIEGHFTSARGRKSMNRVLVIEASGDETGASSTGAVPVPRLELKPLQAERQGDALFQNYETNNAAKIRSSFRLTPLFVGLSDDFSYATAKTAYEVAETQVFKPERTRFDDMFNLKLLSTWKPKYWRYKSDPPKLSDGSDIIAALAAFDSVGALTPNVAITLGNKYFDIEIPKVKEPWGDYPMAIVLDVFLAEKLKFEGLENATPPAPLPSAAGQGVGTGVVAKKPTKPNSPAQQAKTKPATKTDLDLAVRTLKESVAEVLRRREKVS